MRQSLSYLSANVTMTVIDRIVLQVVLGYVYDAVRILAFKLLLACSWLRVTED